MAAGRAPSPLRPCAPAQRRRAARAGCGGLIYSRAGQTLAKSLQPRNGLPRLSPEEALKGGRRGATAAAGAGALAGLNCPRRPGFGERRPRRSRLLPTFSRGPELTGMLGAAAALPPRDPFRARPQRNPWPFSTRSRQAPNAAVPPRRGPDSHLWARFSWGESERNSHSEIRGRQLLAP